jgi:hypothetical protein
MLAGMAKWTSLSLPTITTSRNDCGDCRECCIAYPLLPDERYWPDGKRAGTPCKFLGNGCAIHDQPRPSVCTDFKCSYLKGVVPERPDQNGVIFACQPLDSVCQGQFERWQTNGWFPDSWGKEDLVVSCVECRPKALLALEPGKLCGWFRKLPWRLFVVTSHGLDLLDALHSEKARLRYHAGDTIAVWWCDTPDYAEEILRWWRG